MKKKILVLLACAGAFFSCAKVPTTTQAQYRKGLKAAQEEDWGRATELLSKALEGNLSPKEQERAKIYLADSYFNDGDFENAALNYEEFLELYPASSYAKDALFRLGVCYLNLIKGPQWDQTFTKRAFNTFKEFLNRYPQDSRVSKAKEYLNLAKKILAEHEIYIGGTYDMLHKFTGSIQRYKLVKNKYSDVEPKDRLDYLLGRAYYFTNIQAEEEISRLKDSLDREKEKLESKDPDEVRVAKNRIALIEKDIKRWKEVAKENRKIGEKILSSLAKNYPKSPYGIKARRILLGEKLLAIEPVENPIKHSIWWKIKETF